MELLLSECDLAYTAGLFDGEGMIRIAYSGGRLNPRHSLHLSITNTKRDVLDWLQAAFGGNVYTETNQPRATRPRYSWKMTGDLQIVRFLCRIARYSRIKGDEIALALDFVATVTRLKGPSRPLRLTEGEIALRQGYYLALMEAKRGKTA